MQAHNAWPTTNDAGTKAVVCFALDPPERIDSNAHPRRHGRVTLDRAASRAEASVNRLVALQSSG